MRVGRLKKLFVRLRSNTSCCRPFYFFKEERRDALLALTRHPHQAALPQTPAKTHIGEYLEPFGAIWSSNLGPIWVEFGWVLGVFLYVKPSKNLQEPSQ